MPETEPRGRGLIESGVSKKLLEGGLTAALLALLLFNDHSPLKLFQQGERKQVAVEALTPELQTQSSRHAAFLAAQQDILPSLPYGIPIGWCSETMATFTRTPDADFLTLQAAFDKSFGKSISRHWIVRLEPRTYRVMGKVTWEE